MTKETKMTHDEIHKRTHALTNMEINEKKVMMIENSFAHICHNESMIDVQAAILCFSAQVYHAYAKYDPDILEEHAENFKHNFICFVKQLHEEEGDKKR